MNFSPFGGPFPASIPGIHQFAASGALGSSASGQDANRYHSSSVNMPHFNQSHAPILSKFRSDDIVNSNMNKYNGHNNTSSSANNQYSVPYTTHQQSSDDKQRSITSYSQSTHGSSSGSVHQPQHVPELSQVSGVFFFFCIRKEIDGFCAFFDILHWHTCRICAMFCWTNRTMPKEVCVWIMHA